MCRLTLLPSLCVLWCVSSRSVEFMFLMAGETFASRRYTTHTAIFIQPSSAIHPSIYWCSPVYLSVHPSPLLTRPPLLVSRYLDALMDGARHARQTASPRPPTQATVPSPNLLTAAALPIAAPTPPALGPTEGGEQHTPVREIDVMLYRIIPVILSLWGEMCSRCL